MSRNKKSKSEDFKQEDVLQAVVIADSFNVRFAPITHNKPRALIPLVNIPLIEYTLECLCTSEIQEVVLFCCSHAEQIRKYIKSSKWSSPTCPMVVEVVLSHSCQSVGDALREIDTQSLISSDFVLVTSDIISNVQLKPLLLAHKERRLKEKTPIMTVLMKKVPPSHTTRCREEDVIVAIEKSTQKVVGFEKTCEIQKIDIPLPAVQGQKNVSVTFDLLDTHISICSPTVPQLFTDNFDYLTKEDFVRGIVVSEEILGNTVHVHLLEEEYAARVSNLHMYDAISKDVVARWVYPMVPDKNISGKKEKSTDCCRHHIYLNSQVALARGCILEENVVIGAGTSVGSNTRITHSVIGKNVTIGENVVINGAYIWDNCTIEDGCVISMCILDNDVHLKCNVTVKPGCVLGKNVGIGRGVELAAGTSLTATKPLSDSFAEDEDESGISVDASLVGSEGSGYLYVPEVDSDDEGEEIVQEAWGVEVASESERDSSDEETDSGEEEQEDDEMDVDSRMFYEEVVSTLERGLSEDIEQDNIILEINSAKSAYGIYIKEVNLMVIKALFQLPVRDNPTIEVTQYWPKVKTYLKKLFAVVKNYIRSAESQGDCLDAIQECCVSHEVIANSIPAILHHLYDEDVLSEDVILSWHKTPPITDAHSNDTERIMRIKREPRLVKFVEWLEEAEEESD